MTCHGSRDPSNLASTSVTMTLHYHLVREQEQPSLSRTHHGEYDFTTESSDQTVEDLMNIVQERIVSLEEFKARGLKAQGVEIRIYEVIQLW